MMKRLLLVLVVVAAAVVPLLAMGGTASACTEGLTPGYWKNIRQHPWPTGYCPTDDFDTAFGLPQGTSDIWAADGNLSLMEALRTGGGGFYAFNRHAAAGLLNSALHAMGELDYMDYDWVQQRVWHAYAFDGDGPGGIDYEWSIPNEVEYQKDKLEANNELGVPWD